MGACFRKWGLGGAVVLTALAVALVVMVAAGFAQEAAALSGEESVALIRARVIEGFEEALAKRSLEELTAWRDSLDAEGRWADIDYANQRRYAWPVVEHLDRARLLATAWQCEGHPLKGNAAALDAASRALANWLKHDLRNPNWFHNSFSVPSRVGQILAVAGDALPEELFKQAIPFTNRSNWKAMPGQNLVYGMHTQLYRACATRSETEMKEAFDCLYGVIKVQPPGGEGIQADFSFHQHGNTLLSGSYGYEFARDCGELIALSWGTAYQIPPETLRAYSGFLLDHLQWTMRGKRMDYAVIGRSVARKFADALPLAATLEALQALDLPRADEYRAWRRRILGEPAAPGDVALSGNRMYPVSDYMAHRRAGFLLTTKMHSTRTKNTDGAHNGEGRFSHFMGDGVNFIYRQGDEYVNIFPVWNWRHVPGTTVMMDPDSLDPAKMTRMGTTDFVGGVSDGHVGLAAMDHKRGPLQAKKAWFYFDGGVVCLGAGIRCDAELPVHTTVNQCIASGTCQASGEAISLGDGVLEFGAGAMVHDGIGYWFGKGSVVRVKTDTRTGSWNDIGKSGPETVTKDVFELWLDHGSRPEAADYAYAVFPDCGADTARALEMLEKSQTETFQILENSEARQAVRFPAENRWAIAFWTAGGVELPDLGLVKTSTPCLVMIVKKDAEVALHVACPDRKVSEPVVLTVAAQWTGEMARFDTESSRTLVTIPVADLADGGTVTVHLSAK